MAVVLPSISRPLTGPRNEHIVHNNQKFLVHLVVLSDHNPCSELRDCMLLLLAGGFWE